MVITQNLSFNDLTSFILAKNGMHLQMIRLLGLDQEAAVPQGAFQFIMLHTAQNKKTSE